MQVSHKTIRSQWRRTIYAWCFV